MAQCVVHGFEAIKVNKQDAQWRRFPLTAPDGTSQLLREETAICDSSQFIELSTFFKLAGSTPGFRHIAKCNETTDQFTLAIVQALSIDTQQDVGLIGCSVNCDLIGKLFASARAHQRQVGGITVTVPRLIHTAKGLLPGEIGLHTRTDAEHGARRRINVENVAGAVDDDNAVIDVFQYR